MRDQLVTFEIVKATIVPGFPMFGAACSYDRIITF